MESRVKLLREIKAFLAESGMAATTFGQRAASNSHLVGRLEKGGNVTGKVADKITAYIADERTKLRKEKKLRPLARTCLA